MIICIVLLSVLLIFLFLVAPGRRYRGSFDFTKYRYAHRGLHDEKHAENSLSAIVAAKDAGFGVELDVRLCAEGDVVVFHDPDLKRACGIEKAVAEMTAGELKEVSLFDTGEGIPLLSDVLSAVDGGVPLLIEIKQDTPADQALTPALLTILQNYHGPYLIQSFNPLSLKAVRRLAPDVFRGALSDHLSLQPQYRTAMHRALELFLLNFLSRPQFIAFHDENASFLPFRLMKKIFRLPTFAYTVRSESQEEDCRRMGFDTVVFENYLPKEDTSL